jgi:hypothetical protein
MLLQEAIENITIFDTKIRPASASLTRRRRPSSVNASMSIVAVMRAVEA